VLLFLALDLGEAFAARAASKALLGPVAFSAFVLAYAWTCRKAGIFISVLAGWAAFFLASFATLRLETPLWFSFLLSLGVLGVANNFLPRVKKSATRRAKGAADLGIKVLSMNMGLRVAAALSLAMGLITFGSVLGPDLSGILAPFPVVTTVLAGFSQHSDGPAGAAYFLAGSLRGMLAFACFSLALAFGLERFGLALSFMAAIAAIFAVQGFFVLKSAGKDI
jgi:hypothetical protein